MDRCTILSNMGAQSHKRSNDDGKITESALSNEIHDNLRALSLIHPFSDDLRDVFERGMFIKPNSKAFPHVMKYLLTICDATEFKKRFCWPIYNKAAEATFRNSTLELLNKLNTRHSLGLGEIKNKILIFPGGVEFMRVIFELSHLSMQLILKRSGVVDNQSLVSHSAAKDHLHKLEDVCNFVMDFKKKIQDHSVQMKAKTEMMNELVRKVTKNTKISIENILHDHLADSWSDVHIDFIERGIEPSINYLMDFQSNCQKMDEEINEMFKKRTITFDSSALETFSTEMRKLNPQNYQQMSILTKNGHINLDHFLGAFVTSIPLMLQTIECYKPPRVEMMAFETKQLEKLSHRTDILLERCQNFSEPVEEPNELPEGSVAPAFEQIQSMILSTPTISRETLRRADQAVIHTKRISMLEDAYQVKSTRLPFNSILEESRVNRSAQKVFLSPARLFNKDPKSKLDAMAMLNSITKKSKLPDKQGNKFKPKGMNFGNRATNSLFLESTRTNDTTLSIPDFSSTLLNQSNEMSKTQCHLIEEMDTSLARSISKVDRQKRSVLATDLNGSESEVNRSPSGRIEALVKTDIQLSGIKPIKTMESNDQQGKRKALSSSIFGKSLAGNLSNIENNQNAPNAGAFSLNKLIDENDESLLNMSDRILDDLNTLDLDDSI